MRGVSHRPRSAAVTGRSLRGIYVGHGQKLMQATSDIFLGWLYVDAGDDGRPRDFYVRRLKDWKGSAEIEQRARTPA